MGYIALLHMERGVGDFRRSQWVTGCLKTYEFLEFVRQSNHLSIDAIHISIPFLKYIQILQINSEDRTFVDVFVYLIFQRLL